MNRNTLVTVAVVLSLVLAGCTGSAEYQPSTTTTTTTMDTDDIVEQSYTAPEHPDTRVEELKWRESKYQQLNVTRAERLVAEKINEYRAEHNTSRMAYDPELASVALYHSWEMADLDYFAHESPKDGSDVRAWLDEYNYTYNTWEGENIAISGVRDKWLNSSDPEEQLADQIFWLWKTSESHRKLMLKDYFKVQGVGIYVETDGTYYATLMVVE